MRKIITIGREFGSGGRELGRCLSEQLQIAYYDREIVTEIAKRTRSSEEYVRRISEKKAGGILSHSCRSYLSFLSYAGSGISAQHDHFFGAA